MMNERKRLEYEQRKKLKSLALFFTCMFGPFGLFYTGKWMIPIILVCCMIYRIYQVIVNLFTLNPEQFIVHLAWAIGLWIGSIFISPMLVVFYNDKLKRNLL